jgi:hypothetical protein
LRCDPSAGNFAERADRPGDLAFEGTPVIDLLQELSGAEGRPVEDLESDSARGRQTAGRELEPQLVNLRRRHADRSAAFVELVVDLRGLEPGNDVVGRLGIEIREQQRVTRTLDPVHRRAHDPDDEEERSREADALSRR